MKGSLLILVSILVSIGPALSFPKSSSGRATPEEFLAVAIEVTTGISTALETAAQDIHNALADDAVLAASVQSILDVAYNNAAGILVPALGALEAATSEQEAVTIVQNTLSHLMFLGLDTEFKVEDAMAASEANLQEAVHSISAALTKEIKVQVKPLWDLLQVK